MSTNVQATSVQTPAQVLLPSLAYDGASGTLVNRLSEAMFASLLAAYVIGFVSFMGNASLAEIDLSKDWTSVLTHLPSQFKSLQLVLVSLSFALFTTGAYLSYHMTILPMPSHNLNRVYRDFLFAVLQGIGFGIVMCQVRLLGPFLTLLALFGAYIHKKEVTLQIEDLVEHHLSEAFKKRTSAEHHGWYPFGDYKQKLNRAVREELKKQNLKDWTGPGSPLTACLPLMLGIFALAILYAVFVYADCRIEPAHRVYIDTFVSIAVTAVVSYFTLPLIWRGGRFLQEVRRQAKDGDGYDSRYLAMIDALGAKK